MPFCTQCGKSIEAVGAKFCAECGTPVTTPSALAAIPSSAATTTVETETAPAPTLPLPAEKDSHGSLPASMKSKILLAVWALTTAGIVWLFGYIFFYGTDPDRQQLARTLGGIWGVATVFLVSSNWKATKQKAFSPYGRFVFGLVCFTAVIAGGMFVIASATAQGSPNAFTTESIPLIGLIVTLTWVYRSWSAIIRAEPETNPEFLQKHRTFQLKAGASIAAVLIVVCVAGAFAGVRASHMARIDALMRQMSDLTQTATPKKQRFMELARKDPPNLEEYLQRCAELGPALNDYEADEVQMDGLFSRVQDEIAALKPNNAYARSVATINVSRQLLAKDLEAAKIYRKEIEYAKQLPEIPVSGRLHFWEANIQPVLEQEAKSAHDEVELLKNAKAQGVQMPENLYEEMGIK